jgi:transcriptional regulator with XRE-family HTH domain
MATFGERLRQLRIENNLRQKDLSEEIDIGVIALSYYENDKREPNLKVIRLVCNHFNISADYFLGLSDERANLRVN